jgi:hypothetical protein
METAGVALEPGRGTATIVARPAVPDVLLAKLARHVGWTVIAQQPWSMQNPALLFDHIVGAGE